MQVAIVEDNKNFQLQLKQYLSRFAEEEQVSVHAEVFDDGMTFVTPYQPKWDLILLDIEMPLLNGMDTARAVRKTDPEVPILFITSIAQYAMEGYSVGALNYLLKPIQYTPFAREMKRVLRLLEARPDDSLLVASGSTTRVVPLSSIYYIEVFNHTLLYHTAEGTFSHTGKGTISSLAQDLSSKGFFRIHKSYVVHLKYVESVEKTTAVLKDGTKLDIGRDRKKPLLQALMSYWGG